MSDTILGYDSTSQTKTPEEKAREEAETMISEYANNSHISREYYAEGYLSGYHSRDEEAQELREALKDAFTFVDKMYAQNHYDEDVQEIRNKLIKAKQLFNKP